MLINRFFGIQTLSQQLHLTKLAKRTRQRRNVNAVERKQYSVGSKLTKNTRLSNIDIDSDWNKSIHFTSMPMNFCNHSMIQVDAINLYIFSFWMEKGLLWQKHRKMLWYSILYPNHSLTPMIIWFEFRYIWWWNASAWYISLHSPLRLLSSMIIFVLLIQVSAHLWQWELCGPKQLKSHCLQYISF